MCEICMKAQDEAKSTGDGATADAWHRFAEAFYAWIASLPDDHPVHDMSEKDRAIAWAEHMDATTVDRVIN